MKKITINEGQRVLAQKSLPRAIAASLACALIAPAFAVGPVGGTTPAPSNPQPVPVSAPAPMAAAPAPAPAPAKSAAQEEGWKINLIGIDIESAIKAVGQFTNTNFVIDPRVKGTITLTSDKALNKAQTFNLLTSALRLQGFTVVTGDGYSKVVPEGDAKLQASPTHAGANAIPVKGDQIATQVFRLNYESSMNLVTILRPLISPNNTINANPGNNTLVITDYADNLTRLGKIIAALDAPSAADVDVIPVRHAVASDLAVMVNRLMEPSGAGADSGRVTVLADPRTNALILRAPSVARANLAKSLISKLDQPTKQPGNVHVVYLKNADATKLAQTLRGVVSGDSGAQSSSSSSNSSASITPASPANNSSTGVGLTPSTGPSNFGGSNNSSALSSGGAAGFIQADAATNTLLITANEATYRNLRAVIDQLDVRRVQVYIESLIVEVNSDLSAEFGIQWMGLSGSSSSKYRIGGIDSIKADNENSLLGLAGKIAAGSKTPSLGAGLSLGLFKQQADGRLGLGAIAHMLQETTGANVLSTPNLLTLDNEEAKIVVGKNLPFTTGQYTNTGSGSGSTINPFQTIERKDVGLQLRVKPQVSEGGTVKLAIYQESSSVDDSTPATSAGPTTRKRSIETNVIADDGQIIVLGGLIEDQTSDGESKVPGLGDLPVVGNLFKYQSRKRNKSNLLVFLRPTVLRTAEQSDVLLNDRYDYIRNSQISAQPKNSVLPNIGSPQLPQLEKDGKPAPSAVFVKPVPPAPAAARNSGKDQ